MRCFEQSPELQSVGNAGLGVRAKGLVPAGLDPLQQQGDALADADAHGGDGTAGAAVFQGVHGGERQAGAGHAQGVAERNCAAMGVYVFGIVGQAEQAGDG